MRRLHAEGDVSSLALLAAIDRHLGLHQEALGGLPRRSHSLTR